MLNYKGVALADAGVLLFIFVKNYYRNSDWSC